MLTLNTIVIAFLASSYYFESQRNKDEEDDSLKYRYIKMKGDASAEQIATLEDIFELNRNTEAIEQMREDVETYEEAVRKQAALAEQARLKEQMAKQKNDNLLTYGGHLEVLRKMLFKVLGVSIIFAIVIFCYKDITWDLLLAPSEYDFITYRWIEDFIHLLGIQGFHFEKFEVELIATDLSSQFMTHVTTAIYLGLLCASPYILYELFKFISPALLENEKKYSTQVLFIVYALFIAGVMMSYFILFPISFRFLGTYNVAEKVSSLISLNSYISTFTSLTLLMGVVFQLSIVIFILAKKDILSFRLLAKYRKVALFIIAVISAIITPPDIMTCILVTLPLYALYECSIWIARRVDLRK